MSIETNEPLHEVVLKILYNSDKKKPVSMSAKDVLWGIDNPEITEREIKEVLDWLVRERRATFYLNKYSLDRHEFLVQRAKDNAQPEETGSDKPGTYLLTQKRTTKRKWGNIILVVGVLALLVMTCLIVEMASAVGTGLSFSSVEAEGLAPKKISMKRLYLPDDGEAGAGEKIEQIAKALSRQNINNQRLKTELAGAYHAMDSMNRAHVARMGQLERKVAGEMRRRSLYISELTQKIAACNILFILIIICVFTIKRR